MERKILKKILRKHYDSEDSIKSISCGRMKPSYEKMLDLEADNIPFTAWKDIQSFINDNSISNQSTKSNTENIEKVS